MGSFVSLGVPRGTLWLPIALDRLSTYNVLLLEVSWVFLRMDFSRNIQAISRNRKETLVNVKRLIIWKTSQPILLYLWSSVERFCLAPLCCCWKTKRNCFSLPSRPETKASRRLFSPSVKWADSVLSFWRRLRTDKVYLPRDSWTFSRHWVCAWNDDPRI